MTRLIVKTDNYGRGFVVKSTAQALETFNSLSLEYEPTIEDDGTVTIQDQDVS